MKTSRVRDSVKKPQRQILRRGVQNTEQRERASEG